MNSKGNNRENGDMAHIIQFTLAANSADRRRRPSLRARPERPRPPASLDDYALLLPWSVMGSHVRPDIGGWLSGPCL